MRKVKVDRPLFIIGSARSGSTLLYQLLAANPDVCWVSRLTDRFPSAPRLSVVHRLLDAPGIGTWLRRRVVRGRASWLTPAEGAGVFEQYLSLLGERRSTEDDYDPSTHARMNAVLAGHAVGSGKHRFVSKRNANTQRIRLLNRMYPDALFLHLIRDGRAVAESLTRMPWWDDVDIWWFGGRAVQWRAAGRSDLELTALHWQHDTEEALSARSLMGPRYHEVRYEDLVRDPRAVLRSICDYAGYAFPESYAALVPRTLPNMNRKWQQNLGDEQRRIVYDAVGQFLRTFGYGPE